MHAKSYFSQIFSDSCGEIQTAAGNDLELEDCNRTCPHWTQKSIDEGCDTDGYGWNHDRNQCELSGAISDSCGQCTFPITDIINQIYADYDRSLFVQKEHLFLLLQSTKVQRKDN